MAYLTIKEAKKPSRKVDFTGRAVIGRMNDCEVVIKDGHSSRRHVVIYRCGSDYFLHDLNTRNGTLVNGERITTRRLHFDDDILIGLTRVKLRDDGSGISAKVIAGMDVFEKLGEGRLSRTFRARQKRLGRDIALKLYRVEQREDVDAWFNSVAKTAQVHPNIAGIYDIGIEGDDKYVAMEFVRGVSLEKRLRSEQRLSPAECVSMLSQAAEALAHAHNNGVVHGNLRPNKILIQPDGVVKLVDFGMAPPKVSVAGNNSDLKADPAYLSPEQCQGAMPGPSSDIYALGAIMYRVVTGHPLFQGTDAHDIIQQQMFQSPVPARDIVPNLPDAVVSLLDRMLAKSPSERFASGAELVDGVAPLVGHSSSPGLPAEPLRQALSPPIHQQNRRSAPHSRPASSQPGNPAVALIVGFLLIVMLYSLFLGGRELGRQAVWFKQHLIELMESDSNE